MPLHVNPAEFLLDMMNIDFASQNEAASARLHRMQRGWVSSSKVRNLALEIESVLDEKAPLYIDKPSKKNFSVVLTTLIHRSFVKSYRDVVAYGIRLAMYTGLAIMVSIWQPIFQFSEQYSS
jgi:hypothetical protein